VVNNSRNLIFAHAREQYRDRFNDSQWQDAVAEATKEMNAQLKR
jgi:orotidine-5'-phosphate decarboxylase